MFCKQPRSLKINDTNGQLLSDTTSIANRWKEYFQDLLNRPRNQNQRPQHVLQSVEPLIETPSYEEVKEAIQKLKPNKSPGKDNIPAESIKSAGAELWHQLHRIITRV